MQSVVGKKSGNCTAWAAGIALLSVIFFGEVRSAKAFPITDAFGNTCDHTELISDGSGGSICPASAAGSKAGSNTKGSKIFKPRLNPGLDAVVESMGLLTHELNNDDYATARYQSNRLGMSVGPDMSNFGGSGGGFSARTKGVVATSAIGQLAAGSIVPNSSSSGGSGNLYGIYDASHLVGVNQRLSFGGAFAYTSTKTSFDEIGTVKSDTYSLHGLASYDYNGVYLDLSGAYWFGKGNEFNAPDGSSGGYRINGYNVDARLSHVFVLVNTIGAAAPTRMPVKALAKSANGYLVGLDLSGHLGYSKNTASGFTDSTGFLFGDEQISGGLFGLRAKLFSAFASSGVTWMPYLAGAVDWRLGYSHQAFFPAQAAIFGGDTVTYADATTAVSAQLGLDVRTTNGWTLGVNTFYTHTSDFNAIGGRASLRIPFGAAAVSARY